MKKFTALLLCLSLLLSLAACGNQNKLSSAQAKPEEATVETTSAKNLKAPISVERFCEVISAPHATQGVAYNIEVDEPKETENHVEYGGDWYFVGFGENGELLKDELIYASLDVYSDYDYQAIVDSAAPSSDSIEFAKGDNWFFSIAPVTGNNRVTLWMQIENCRIYLCVDKSCMEYGKEIIRQILGEAPLRSSADIPETLPATRVNTTRIPFTIEQFSEFCKSRTRKHGIVVQNGRVKKDENDNTYHALWSYECDGREGITDGDNIWVFLSISPDITLAEYLVSLAFLTNEEWENCNLTRGDNWYTYEVSNSYYGDGLHLTMDDLSMTIYSQYAGYEYLYSVIDELTYEQSAE